VTKLEVLLYPVSFALEAGPARFVSLGQEDGSPLSTRVRGEVQDTALTLLTNTVDELIAQGLTAAPKSSHQELRRATTRHLEMAGVVQAPGKVQLVYTAPVPTPLAETELDVSAGSSYAWQTVSASRGKQPRSPEPRRRTGPDAAVLDYWRQAFEETNFALDFLPEHFTLLQLRSLYDAVWGYDQDPSGFKRWAVERAGAFRGLLEDSLSASERDAAFFGSLGGQLSPDDAARAGAMSRGSLTDAPLPPDVRLPIGIAAATKVNRLYTRPGPAPAWYRKVKEWRSGPTWIESVYPPRPDWTLWDTGR
jgi:hypothetical protein